MDFSRINYNEYLNFDAIMHECLGLLLGVAFPNQRLLVSFVKAKWITSYYHKNMPPRNKNRVFLTKIQAHKDKVEFARGYTISDNSSMTCL